jgi:hypothetical protein
MSRHPDYELLPLNDWATEDDAGFILNDPISGQPIDPNQPPAFLLEKTALNDGYNYLKYTLAAVELGMFYGTGESRAEDLGDPDVGALEGILSPADGDFQAVGHTVDGVVRTTDNDMLALSSAGTPYTERIKRAAEAGGLAVFCMGLEVDLKGAPASRTERALLAINDMAAVHALESEADQSDLSRAVLLTIARNAEQWYRVLSAGERLQHTAAILENEVGVLRAAMIAAPIADAGYTYKFQAMGLAVGERAVDPVSYSDDMQWETVVMQQGRIDINGK